MASMTRSIKRNIIRNSAGTKGLASAWHRYQNMRYQSRGEESVSLYQKAQAVCSGFAFRVSKALKKLKLRMTKESRKINRREL